MAYEEMNLLVGSPRARGFMVGSLVGAAIGLLFAPKEGKETREVMRSKTGEYATALRDRFRRSGAEEEEVKS